MTSIGARVPSFLLDMLMTQNYRFWKGDAITSMTGNNIFVYGANPQFRNGLGGASDARAFGAIPFGGGRRIVGNTYGLVTKNLVPGYTEKATGITYHKSGYRSLTPEMISKNIDELYCCALDNPDKLFFISYKVMLDSRGNLKRSLNGYNAKEMWDMFTRGKTVPPNITFHESYKRFL